jgi:hypothetical protein
MWGLTRHVQTTKEPAMPEPSTIALALLASGAAGVLAWRRQAVAARGQV